MCKMISCLVSRDYKVFAANGLHSHSEIAEKLCLDEDKYLKYEYPLSEHKFPINEENLKQDWEMDKAPFEAKAGHDNAALYFIRQCAETPEKLIAFVRKDNWDEGQLVSLLTDPARAEYNKVRSSALAEYKKVESPAIAEYKKVQDPAFTEYKKVQGPAWTEYDKVRGLALAEYNKACSSAFTEYKKVQGLAFTEYEKVHSSAWTEYNKVRSLALAEYKKVQGPAFTEYEKVRSSAIAEYEKACIEFWCQLFEKAENRK